jgi:hypothetical protein
MPTPFRSDLDAARNRVDALSEENEDLREQLAQFEKGQPPQPAAGAAPPSAEDPELAALAKHTLERLDQLSTQIERAPSTRLEALPHFDEQPPQPRAPEIEPRNHNVELMLLRDKREHAEELHLAMEQRGELRILRLEIAELRSAGTRASRLAAVVFAIGLGLGLLIGALVR